MVLVTMLMKKPEHKRFEYLPRYYKEESDRQNKFKNQFELARKSYLIKRKNNKIFWYFILITFIIYLLVRFGIA